MGHYSATLMVDASWCPETHVAGYGFWIASNRGKLPGSGTIKGRVESSNLAEMQAICIVLYIAKKMEYVLPWENVLIQTDCLAAIYAFERTRKVSGSEADALRKYLELSLEQHVELRHVKGHTGSYNPRFLANRMCDIRARKAMRDLRDSLKGITDVDFQHSSRREHSPCGQVQK